MKSTEQVVREIIMRHFSMSADQVSLEASLWEDLGADSRSLIELMFTLEETFNVPMPNVSGQQLRTVGDVVRVIELAQRHQPVRAAGSVPGAVEEPLH